MGSRKEAISRFVKAINLKAKIDRGGTRIQTTLPGLSYGDFDRTGHPSIWKILHLCNTNRFFHHAYSNYMDEFRKEEESGKHFHVSLGQTFQISREFYELAKLDCPMSFTTQIFHVGQKSFSTKITLAGFGSDEELVSVIRNFTFIDVETRSGIPIPKMFRDSILPFRLTNIPNIIEPIHPEDGQASYEYPVKVVWSDTDISQHVNQNTYIQYCMNCATQASMDNLLTNFWGDMCAYKVLKGSVLYTGEAYAGDDLLVQVWEDTSNEDVLHFKINRNGERITHCSLLFLK